MRRVNSVLRGSWIRKIGVLRGGLWLAALCAAVAAVVIVVVPASGASSTSSPKTALLDGSSVTTNDGIENAADEPISLEQYAAEQDGYTVTVVTGSQWEALSAEEFAKYQLLIVGDPQCSSTAYSAIVSAPTWAPVVMGTSGLNPLVGNRALVGTDPEYHYAAGAGNARPTNPAIPTTAGAEHLEQDAIAYAGGVSGATGVYFDTSCGDPNPTPIGEAPVPDGDLSVLELLTASGPGQWEENSGDVPCGANVQQIAENPSFDSGPTKLEDSDIEGWGCSDHVAFPHFPVEWDALAVAKISEDPGAEEPTCGTDPDTAEKVCGEAYVLVAGEGIVAEAPNLKLEPSTGSEFVGGTHTVTAKVTQDGSPVAGTVVSFLVTGTNAGVTGTCTSSVGADPTCATDEAGEVEFTYSDEHGAGIDTINASVTLGATTEKATASEEWTEAPRIAVTPVKHSDVVGGTHTVTAKVTQDGSPVAGTVVSFLVTGTNAGVTGTCTSSVGADPTCATDEAGEVQFTYSDEHGAGTDTISASFTWEGIIKRERVTEEWTATVATSTGTAASAGVLSAKEEVLPAKEAVKACASRRKFTIHIQNVKQLQLVSATVTINGHKTTLRGKHLSTAINLVGLPKGTFTVKIVARRRDGKLVRAERIYHTCVSKLPGQSYLLL